jgi:hypothetical protein
MKTIDLKRCLDGLKSLRASKHRTLDAGAVAELDAVIWQLELCLGKEGDVEIEPEQAMRALLATGRCIELVTNLSEIIKNYFDSN